MALPALTGNIRPLLACLLLASVEGLALPKAEPPVFVPEDSLYARELTVKLLTPTAGGRILYTPSRTPPDTVEGGGTRLFGTGIVIGGSDSITLSARTVAPGYAPSDVVTKTYYKEKRARIVSAYYSDPDGDGRIGHVHLNFAVDLPEVPERFDFRLSDPDGRSELRQARSDHDKIQIPYPDYRYFVSVELKEPFPFGMTSLVGPDSAGRTYAQAGIPLEEYHFPIQDKVCPIILDAKLWVAADSSAPSILYVTFSEDMVIPETVYQPFEYLKGGEVYAFYDVDYGTPESIGRRTYAFPIFRNPWFQPVPGDSVAITRMGEIKDLAGNKGSTVDPYRFVPIVKTLAPPVGVRLGPSLPTRAIRMRGGRLVWTGRPEPLGLDCFDLGGAFLGKARGREGRWGVLPGTKVIRARLPNGSQPAFLVSPAE